MTIWEILIGWVVASVVSAGIIVFLLRNKEAIK